jgi:ElaB/YqjD/DUF883 family membrane-anchored ribosome-binding protein
MSHPNTDKLLDDLKQVIHDAEELLRATAGQAGEHISKARERAEASLRTAKEQLAMAGGTAADTARCAAGHTDAYVRTNPWIAVGVGALAGLLTGLVIGRRRGGP